MNNNPSASMGADETAAQGTCFVVMGFGMSFIWAPMTTAMLNSVETVRMLKQGFHALARAGEGRVVYGNDHKSEHMFVSMVS